MIEQLLDQPAFRPADSDSRSELLSAMNAAYRWHVEHCAPYARFCARRGFTASTIFESFESIPFLPVQAFKQFGDVLHTNAAAPIRTRLHSSATSGRPSTVLIDSVTARRQVKALASVLREELGGRRRSFIVCDVDPAGASSGALGARGAAVRGFLNLAKDVRFVLSTCGDGKLVVNHEVLNAEMARLREQPDPFAVFGFTFVLFESVMEPLLDAPPAQWSNAHLLHIGGWKKLADRNISPADFARAAQHVFGVSPDRIVDFYGFTEQMGVVYPAKGLGDRRIPAFAHVIVRDPDTQEALPLGQPGLLQFLTPLPASYPGISVLTDDVGMLIPSPSGEVTLRVLGRAKNAEIRGCGDIMGDKVLRPSAPGRPREAASPRLLFSSETGGTSADPLQPVDLTTLPVVENVSELVEQLRVRRGVLDSYSFDELTALFGAAAQKWLRTPALLPLLPQGLAFVAAWCRPDNLARLGAEALRGSRAHLDGFRPLHGRATRQVRAYPRGVAAHWLSGNVPLLGMLALVQSVLARNANVLKAASVYTAALPALLEAFRGLEVKLPSGRIAKGDDVLSTIAVIYFPKENHEAASTLSMSSDVRIAWGGREAMEAIGGLAKRYDAEDVMFGPKLSYMAVGRTALADARSAKKLARRAATDASVFDQYACASPHVIFVERGGAISPREFASLLATEMDLAARRIPKAPIDAGTAGRISEMRMRHEFFGELWTSAGSTWTVAFEDEATQPMPSPCYSRAVTVRAVDDLMTTADAATHDTQTIGLALEASRRQEYADRAAKRGACRFPDIGRMTEFDTVWDGVYLLDRLVRWVSLGGPVG